MARGEIKTLQLSQGKAITPSTFTSYIVKHNFEATGAPTVSDDSTGGWEIGSRWIDTTNLKGYICFDNAVGAALWQETAESGGLGISYITNSDAEANVSDWAVYADVAGIRPVDGIGGSPSLTLTKNETTPLRGSADFKITKGASDLQGEGVSTDIVIAKADFANVLRIDFEYETTVNYADGDARVYIYDIDNASLIEPVATELFAGKGRYVGYFQTSAAGVNYRLIFHLSSTNALAYDIHYDTVSLGPAVKSYGTPITEWQVYTPDFTGSLGDHVIGNGTLVGYERRIGDTSEYLILFKVGSTTSFVGGNNSYFRFGLNNQSIDYTKLPDSGDVEEYFYPIGDAYAFDDSNPNDSVFLPVVAERNVPSHVIVKEFDTKMRPNRPWNWQVNDILSMEFKVPIQGLGSQLQLSDDADTRVVAARAKVTSTSIISGADTTVVFGTVDYDTHGSYNNVTGIYTVSSSGKFQVASHVEFNVVAWTAANTARLGVWVNGGIVAFLEDHVVPSTFTNNLSLNGSTTIDVNKGDTVHLTAYQNTGGAVTLANHELRGYVSFEKVQGPSAIAANELISCRYSTNAAGVIPASLTTINFEDKEFDSHGSVDVGPGWVFTCQASGKYLVTVHLQSDPADFLNGGTFFQGILRKNAINHSSMFFIKAPATGGNLTEFAGNGTALVDLVVGDTLDLQARETSTDACNFTTDTFQNYISIHRIGF